MKELVDSFVTNYKNFIEVGDKLEKIIFSKFDFNYEKYDMALDIGYNNRNCLPTIFFYKDEITMEEADVYELLHIIEKKGKISEEEFLNTVI